MSELSLLYKFSVPTIPSSIRYILLLSLRLIPCIPFNACLSLRQSLWAFTSNHQTIPYRCQHRVNRIPPWVLGFGWKSFAAKCSGYLWESKVKHTMVFIVNAFLQVEESFLGIFAEVLYHRLLVRFCQLMLLYLCHIAIYNENFRFQFSIYCIS